MLAGGVLAGGVICKGTHARCNIHATGDAYCVAHSVPFGTHWRGELDTLARSLLHCGGGTLFAIAPIMANPTRETKRGRARLGTFYAIASIVPESTPQRPQGAPVSPQSERKCVRSLQGIQYCGGIQCQGLVKRRNRGPGLSFSRILTCPRSSKLRLATCLRPPSQSCVPNSSKRGS